MNSSLLLSFSAAKPKEAGFAIGPILFVVAILGILAAAIAAGSGSFNSGTTKETDRTKAAALIEIGQNLKIGFDRIVSLGVAHSLVVLNPNSTSNDNDIFSPTGGGINPPSVTMANTPTSDAWYYVDGAIPKQGTSANEKLAMIRVSATVCDQINLRANSMSTSPNSADYGDILNNTATGGAWPASLQGKQTGCINNSNSASPGWWFYQVLGVQ